MSPTKLIYVANWLGTFFLNRRHRHAAAGSARYLTDFDFHLRSAVNRRLEGRGAREASKSRARRQEKPRRSHHRAR
jgi:hypothetical protein